jgi:hypothetical protein
MRVSAFLGIALNGIGWPERRSSTLPRMTRVRPVWGPDHWRAWYRGIDPFFIRACADTPAG